MFSRSGRPTLVLTPPSLPVASEGGWGGGSQGPLVQSL